MATSENPNAYDPPSLTTYLWFPAVTITDEEIIRVVSDVLRVLNITDVRRVTVTNKNAKGRTRVKLTRDVPEMLQASATGILNNHDFSQQHRVDLAKGSAEGIFQCSSTEASVREGRIYLRNIPTPDGLLEKVQEGIQQLITKNQ